MRKLISLSIIAILLVANCKKDSDEPKVVIPLAPYGLTVVQTSANQINLNWNDQSMNETGFKIERKDGSGSFRIIGTTNANTTTYLDNNGIQPGTVYVYRVYSFNSAGNSSESSNEREITTFISPTITTVAVSQNTFSTAISGGNISSDGGSPIISRGVVWSTSSNPTVNLTTKTVDGTGIGSFSSSITGLTVNTTYFIRSYATNIVGTAYGNEVTIKIEPVMTVAGGNGPGGAPNQFFSPTGVFVDGADNVYVADSRNNRIQKWTPGSSSGLRVVIISNPQDLFIDTKGNIFATTSTTIAHRVEKWVPGSSNGIVSGVFGSVSGSSASQFNNPRGVFVDSNGDIYVADTGNWRVQKWVPGATSGVTVAGGNGLGSGPDQIQPNDVFVDALGNIYVADQMNDRIQKWAPGATSGVTVAGGNGRGAASNQLRQPTDIFVDVAGNIYVADQNNNRIQKWAPGATSGITVAGGNGPGFGSNQLSSPSAVFVDAKGYIYIADTGNNRIQKWAQ